MKIRLITDQDFPTLADIYLQAYNSLDIGEQWDHQSAEKLLQHLHKQQPDLFFVAEFDGKVIGAINAVIKPWWDGNHLTDGELFVHPDHQGKGLGKQLIKHLFTQAKEKYQAVSWDTFTHIVYEHPLRWYKQMGFDTTKHWTMISGNIDTVLNNLNKE